MKLRLNGFENEIILNNGNVNILQIGNSKCFSHIIEVLNDKINGIENNEICLLSDSEEEVNMSKNAYLLFDLFNIDYNSKKILNKIYGIISENVQKNQEIEFEELSLKLRNYIIQEINELPFEFVMNRELDISDMLKIYDLKIDSENYSNVLERVELLIDLISTLGIAQILIIPNLRTFLSDDELVELYKYSLYNDINLILIEKNIESKLMYEKVLIIDDSFDDLYI